MITLRKFPYPYQAMLSYTPDIDGCTPAQFERIHRFLNTHDPDPDMGEGLGLDIANSCWMYNKNKHQKDLGLPLSGLYAMEPETMCYYDGISSGFKDKWLILKYIKCGWIDTVHSWGNFSTDYEQPLTRDMVSAAINELLHFDVSIPVWVDHGDDNNKHNIGINTASRGDDPAYQHYHADLTMSFGIRFVWKFNTTNYPPGVVNAISPLTLADGSKCYAFTRFRPDWFADTIHQQITQSNLDHLKNNNLYAVLGTHLGITAGAQRLSPPFLPETLTSLRNLQAEHNAGNILVARTSRLLKYNLAQLYVSWEYKPEVDRIVISTLDDPQFGPFVPTEDDIRGLTFEGATPTTQIYVNETPVAVTRPTDSTVMIPWFAPDTTNYAKYRWFRGEYVFQEIN